MGKVSDNGLISLVALAGVGLAAASGVSMDDGAKKIAEYVDSGVKAVSNADVDDVASSIGQLNLGKEMDPVFIGTAEIDNKDVTEQDLLKELYPDIFKEDSE